MPAAWGNATTAQVRQAGSTGITCNKPASLANGDVLYAWISSSLYSTTTDFTCSGWTNLVSTGSISGNDVQGCLLRKVITNAAGEPASYTFVKTGDAANNSMTAIIVRATGVSNSVPEDVAASILRGTNDATPATLSVTTANNGSLVLSFLSLSLGTTATKTIGVPSGYTNPSVNVAETSSTADIQSAVAYKTQTTAGATGTNPWTNTADDATTEWCVCTVALREAPASSTVDHVGYRFRSADLNGLGLNADSGWDAAVNTVGTIQPDVKFRLRLEMNCSAGTQINAGTLQMRYDLSGGTSYNSWASVPNNATPDTANTEQFLVQCVSSTQYTDLAATTDLLVQGTGTFVAGHGSHDNALPAITGTAPFHTEHEFCLLIRKLSTNGHVPDGARFQFRYLVGATTETFTVTPEMTVANRPGHIGGASVESPHRTLVRTDEGVLYMVTEYTDYTTGTYNNQFAMMKSTDNGNSWSPQDEGSRPAQKDLEGVDLVYDSANDLIHIIHQGPNTDDVYYHQYRTSAHATPDTWGTVDTLVETVTDGYDQFPTIHRRSNGSLVATYNERNAGLNRSQLKTRSTGGAWQADGTNIWVDDTGAEHNNAPAAILDTGAGSRADGVHLFYIAQPSPGGSTTNGVLKHKFYTGPAHATPDTLSAESTVATGLNGQDFQFRLAICPPIIWYDGTNTRVGVLYATYVTTNADPTPSTGILRFAHAVIPSDPYWTVTDPWTWTTEQVTDASLTVTINGVGSRTVNAGLVANGTDVYAFFVENTDGDVYRDRRQSGAWGTNTNTFSGLVAQLLRTYPIGSTGIGILTDASVGGGTGTQRFDYWAFPASGSKYRLGDITVTALKLGDVNVTKSYLGDTQVF